MVLDLALILPFTRMAIPDFRVQTKARGPILALWLAQVGNATSIWFFFFSALISSPGALWHDHKI